ncbi:MAG: sugar transferase [Wenzhouxiangellaceae bacterium]|nr:sugar transferase [Wenzhouxiangellaceae bacterium]
MSRRLPQQDSGGFAELCNPVAALAGLLVLLPLLILLAVVVRIDSRGPAIYSEQRLGRYGKPFYIYKLRTLHPGLENSARVAPVGDPRITRLGAWLRPLHLDELPQLFNIVRRDMNFVGPRPAQAEIWRSVASESMSRALAFRPGLTSPASIQFNCEDDVLATFDNAEAIYRDLIFPAKITIDVRYFEQRKWWHDLKVLAATATTVLRRRPDTACRERLAHLLGDAGRTGHSG